MIWIDGVFADEALPPSPGGAVFETMGLFRSALPLWDRHLARLLGSLQRLGDAAAAPPADLRERALELLAQNGDDVLRLERRLLPRAGNWVMSTRRRDDAELLRLLPTIVRRSTDAPPADLKAMPRTFHDAVREEARRGGADDGIALGDDGSLLETSRGNLWLLVDSIWTTPPLDGRILPGIARALLLDRAPAAGVPTAERRLELADLHRAAAICVSNAASGVRPGALVGPGAAVAERHSSLRRLWRFAIGD